MRGAVIAHLLDRMRGPLRALVLPYVDSGSWGSGAVSLERALALELMLAPLTWGWPHFSEPVSSSEKWARTTLTPHKAVVNDQVDPAPKMSR